MTTTRTTSSRLLAATTAALLSVGLLAGCTDDEPAATPSASASESSVASDEHMAENITEFSYAGQDGRTALELLQENDPDVGVSGEGEMAFVTTIKGRTASEEDKEFWALYVDGEMAEVGAGSLETEDGQQIQWKLEEFTP